MGQVSPDHPAAPEGATQAVRVRVIDAGSIPLTYWSDRDGRFVDIGPRVMLEVSGDAARALARHLHEDIEIVIRPAGRAGGPGDPGVPTTLTWEAYNRL